MSTDIATAAEFHLVDWWDKNRQRVLWGAMAVALITLVLSFYIWQRDRREVRASEALSSVQVGAATPAAMLQVNAEFRGTAAAARALLLAAGATYTEGRFADAQKLFDRFLAEHPDHASRPAALLGTAACLAAQGKLADAATKYQGLIQRYPNDATVAPAKSALARLYESQGQFAPAMSLYQDLGRTAGNSSFALESMIRLQNLLAAHPELAQAAATTNAAAKRP
jgi:TolA-binding protein